MAGLDMGDWLGTGQSRRQLRQYRSFKKARAFVRGLGLKSQREWRDYCKSGKKPADIPANPHRTYANDGWAGLGDWLGTGTVAPAYVNIDLSRRPARSCDGLGLKSSTEWLDYCKSGKKPDDIPADPSKITRMMAGLDGAIGSVLAIV